MGRIVVIENVSLDGVVQAPGRPDEDTRGGFELGGWAGPYTDAVAMGKMGEGMARTEAMLFGRKTYEDFHGYWPKQTDGNPFTEVLDNATKYVASHTLVEPLPWQNSVLLPGEAVDAAARLRRELDGDVVVLGSGVLVRSLAAAGLVDQYTLMILPLVLGTGTRLFPDAGPFGELELVDSVATTTGMIIATYRPR